ncbi:MAG: aminoacyl-histidine dipeptidase [Alistipes sp.]|jgi:dipeptidase D|nr:aminoacyl-histidine dipeptidase [Alistipes sp.]
MRRLEPRAVWEIFDEITKIPRPSKKEEKIVAWLVDFATRHGLEYRRDAINNIVILKPASRGMEYRPTVVLQNHVDMVCERSADARNASGQPLDFENDPIETYVADGWVRARGTTLGADNGLGMALALALLTDPDAVHGPVEALFTVDEETGLTGAFELGEGMITGRYLINLDSEDEGEVFISCAGGIDTLAYFDYTLEPAPDGFSFFEIAVSGLLGGHSGDDIEKGRGNANKILSRVLWKGLSGYDLRLVTIDGGNLRNAIPREARAVVAVPDGRANDFADFMAGFADDMAAELAHSDAGVKVSLAKAPAAGKIMDTDTTRRLVGALIGVVNGPQAMSFAVPGLVETSTNLASVKVDGNRIVVTTSQRSSVESAKRAVAAEVEAVFTLAGARVDHSDGYPGWAPNPDSHLLEVTKNAYERLFGTPIKVRAIHAGLECGLFLEKFPHLDMVSTGPTILGAHSPDERLEIATVDKSWRLLLEILKTL